MSIPNVNLPTYECLLPSQNRNIKFRPFLVKEQKVLMIANQTGDKNQAFAAIKQIINNCTFNELPIEKLSLLDIEYLFLHLRAKSVGEIIDLLVECPHETCKSKNKLKFDLTKVEVKTNPEHNANVKITDTLGVQMKYPDFDAQIIVAQENKQDIEKEIELAASCIDYIYDENSTYSHKDLTKKELIEFVENLTASQYEKIRQFFDTMPKLNKTSKHKCTGCGKEFPFAVENFYDFFE